MSVPVPIDRYWVEDNELRVFPEAKISRVEVVLATDHDAALAAVSTRLASAEADCAAYKRLAQDRFDCTCDTDSDNCLVAFAASHAGMVNDKLHKENHTLLEQLAQAQERITTLEHRLEIDRVYSSDGREIIVPPSERDKQTDGISCREATIKLQDDAIADLRADLAAVKQDHDRLVGAIRWALGEVGEFPAEPNRLAGQDRQRFYWRTELRRRAFGDTKEVGDA